MEPNGRSTPNAKRRPWETPELKTVGTVGAVLQMGMGKSSFTGADPGDTLKPPGQGPA
jgi:hypothetical protein